MSVETMIDGSLADVDDWMLQGLPRDAFFRVQAEQGLALTFDDSLLDTGLSNVAAEEVDLTTRFSKNIEMKNPQVSAAMDTVTLSEMAIAKSKLGGIGIIGSFLSIEDQRQEVRRVKRALNGKLYDPICVRPDQTLESVLNMCDDNRFGFRSFPVTAKGKPGGKLLGVITQKNFTFHQHSPSTLVSEAMTSEEEVVSAKPGTNYEEAYKLMVDNDKLTLPLVNYRGDVVGLYVWTDVNQAMHGNKSPYNVDDKGRLRVGMAVATNDEALERIEAMRKYIDVVVIDTSKGDHKFAVRILERIKNKFGDLDVVAGNITNGISARYLADAGADGIKVGQGGGAICSTREELAYGCPQLTAVFRCSKALEKRHPDIPVCSDGGITKRGHVALALAAGASSVMMGKMFAGTDEAPGEIIELNGKRWMIYRGMGSMEAMKSSVSSRLRYGSETEQILPEGVTALVEYQGSVNNVVNMINLALRKSMSGYDVSNIAEFPRKARFQRTTENGQRESSPHDVNVVLLQNTEVRQALKKAA